LLLTKTPVSTPKFYNVDFVFPHHVLFRFTVGG